MFNYGTPETWETANLSRGDMGSDLVKSMAPVLIATAIPTVTQTLPLAPGDAVVAVGGPQVWDFNRGVWRTKQRASFDGGWRWLHSDLGAFYTIYNKAMHPQAHTVIEELEIENTPIDAEFVLQCAQARVVTEHNFFESRDWLREELARKVTQARTDIRRTISGFK